MKCFTVVLAIGLLGGCAAPGSQQTIVSDQRSYARPVAQQQATIWPARLEASSPAWRPSSQCAWAAEHIAFAYQVLQTQMMEAALTCGEQDAYNTFVDRQRPALLDSLKQIASHFSRVTGADGESQRDAYITELANAQAQYHRPDFCQSINPVVAQALSLETGADILQFVADQQIPNPYSVPPCASETTSRD